MRIGDQVPSISLPPMGADQSMKHQMLSREEWFHGPISRKDAEQLLLEVKLITVNTYDIKVLFKILDANQSNDS